MKYFGKFGFAESSEVAPGVWEDVITERDYIGDVVQVTEAFSVDGSVLPTYRTTTSVSVISDGVLKKNYKNLRFIEFQGDVWVVASSVQQWPRLIIYIGEVYNGPRSQSTP